MTPERRKYLMKSSNKEREIRGLIRRCKKALSISKSECNAFNLKPADKKPLEYLEKYIQLKDSKILLQALRHELARFKGMGRVAPIILEITRSEDTFEIIDADAFCGCCKQLLSIFQKKSYCPNCGRKILWEKVKK